MREAVRVGRKKLLWVGDACCQSGFAKATHGILAEVSKEYEVFVVGLNYRGDPHDHPYKIVPAWVQNADWAGVNRMLEVAIKNEVDVIVIQQDGWNLPGYIRAIRKHFELAHVKVIAACAVDGQNFDGKWVNGYDQVIFWTNFAKKEAEEGGANVPLDVIPLGVDLELYHQMDKLDARLRRLPPQLEDAFIVGNINRNQPRKRWDLTIRFFALWKQLFKPKDAWLFLHTDPADGNSMNIESLGRYYNIADSIIVSEAPPWTGLTEQELVETYNCFDVQVSTTQGEGFGLTTFEGMACGVPQIVPKWSALGELCDGACWLVNCPTTVSGMPYVGVIGGQPDERQFIMALQTLYEKPEIRDNNRQAGLERVQEKRFRWDVIGRQWVDVIRKVLQPKSYLQEVAR